MLVKDDPDIGLSLIKTRVVGAGLKMVSALSYCHFNELVQEKRNSSAFVNNGVASFLH